jgi:hypothetical protein
MTATGTDMQTGWEMQLLPYSHIQHYWPHIEDMLKRVPQTWQDHTLESLHDRALAGTMQVWGLGPKECIRVVVFTQVVNFPATRVLEVIWMAGEGGLLYGLDVADAVVEDFARTQHCSRIDLYGREGWEKIAKSHGYRKLAVVLSRPVEQHRSQ